MHEGRCYEHAGAEVSGEEERVVWYGKVREAPDDEREGAGEGAKGEDQEEGEDVEACVVCCRDAAGAAFGAGVIVLSAGQFGVEKAEGDVCDGWTWVSEGQVGSQ